MTTPALNHVIIGGGSWGTAIGTALMRAKQNVTLLVRSASTIEALSGGRCQQLPDLKPAAPLAGTMNPNCLASADCIFVVVPVAATISSLETISATARPGTIIVLCAKGLVSDPELKRGGIILTEIADNKLTGFPHVVFSGPSFADEVILGKPAAVTAASSDQDAIAIVQHAFEGSNIRLYGNDDPIGVAIGGAMKNVIAIASGCAVGLGLGDNAKAAILTRGLAEMARFATAMGADANTIYGLSGVGDLALTCSGPHSRNMAYGMALGEGKIPDSKLAEGRHTVAALAARAATMQIEMPITNAVDRVVNHGDNLANVVASLLARKAGTE